MFQRFYLDYFAKVQEANQEWWKNFELNKESIDSSPLYKAIQKISFQDSIQLFEKAKERPTGLLKLQIQWWEQQLQIWQHVVFADNNCKLFKEEKGDSRFGDELWETDVFYSFVKQSYLLFSKTYLDTIDSIEGLDKSIKERVMFISRQIINALSPTNFIATNPELLKLTLKKNGANLLSGLEQFKRDVDSSADILRIRMTDSNNFRIGKDIANTDGNIVFKNDLFELIQYTPLTNMINSTPLLIVPPFINKYYILDLHKKKSMVRWLLEHNHSVFMISWRNPGKDQAEIGFDNYIIDGVVKAISTVIEITNQEEINTVGYCIGGTLLASTISYYSAKRMKKRIRSASFFTTPLDFSQPGELGVYINETIITAIEIQNNEKGYMDGRSLSVIFNLLRENSLYWNYYIENYLKGNTPADFDLLYWNSDSTNVTALCHNFILRELYLQNKLIQKKGIKVGGVWIDLSKIKIPTYFVSTKQDHIVPWQGTYDSLSRIGGDKTFVLGESGHVAGVINHPGKGNKYGYWLNDNLNNSSDEWLKKAAYNKGSWWVHWNQWLMNFNQDQVEPFSKGSEKNPIIGIAPGEYVKQSLPI
ncbi:poly(R)-hydroxyalkanoic acid synthase [Candidatus Photodesmus katoptron]|uniref:Poly(3-hydroxyalkanoate) polymerase n=1 Tax=Candidatus Photodesmus katoptron Akat1 TaxID=1236703 RepID=S3DKM1_9GAMM|nr:class I poly(R)-hydroxyalkanoic acid synthase [Candidatus Photodesmus katoptron]EPE37674.1 poly(3-hydroxyalkanoate) polymerase [Candidatus Photodesmus katoptron Akat1]KEY90606.1 poly(R)-hydroxyalkanoic acid synthase [Candidatus Photodesmus katoptron]